MEEMVTRLQQGDEAAFEEFVTKFERPIYNLALRHLGNPQDAQDAAQEVFLRVYRGIGRFRADAKLSTWVYQIAMNVCVDMVRRHTRHPETSMTQTDDEDNESMIDLPDETYAPEPLYERAALREELATALQQLTPEHREIVVLRDVSGLSYEEIAGVLQLTQGTVKSRLFRARDRLAAVLRGDGNKTGFAASYGQNAKSAGR